MDSCFNFTKMIINLIYHNFLEILILFIIYIILLFFLYLYIISSEVQMYKNLIYYYIITYPITLFLNTYLTIMIKNNLFNIQTSLYERFSKFIKYLPHCLYATFILFFSYLLFIFLFSTVIFIPIIRPFMFFLLVLLLIIFIGYFRFIPYVAIITNSTSKLFQKTFSILSRHLWGSLTILFGIGIFIDIFNSLFSKTITSYLVKEATLFKVLLFFIIYQMCYFILVVFDIAYVTINYKKKYI